MTQTLIVVLLVLAAAAYLGRLAWRTLRPKSEPGCGAGCGCSTPTHEPHRDRRTATDVPRPTHRAR